MQIRFSRTFSKQYKKAPINIQKLFDKKISKFLEDPFSPLFNNHTLRGEFINHRNINITGDWRAIYCEMGKSEVIFKVLGTHSQLYK